MLTHKLTKNITLYKNQFDNFMLRTFGEHKLDRASLDLDALSFRINYMIKHKKDLNKMDEMKKKFTDQAVLVRKVFGDFMIEFLCQIIEIPEFAKFDDIIDLIAQDVKITTTEVKFQMILISSNKKYLEYIDQKIEDGKTFNIFPNEYFRYTTDSYNDAIAKAYPELFIERHQEVVGIGADADVFVHSFTFQTSERCSLNCTYCYQFNKTGMRMEFETAKKFIDHLLNDDYGYINRYNSPAIIIEFIGGEPLLEIKLTRKIYEYFLERCYELDHPYFTMHRLSICSNGLAYFDDEVQSFFKDYHQNISFNISIDGNKELHDTCRIQPNGEGSYDVDMVALNHYNKHYTSERNSKMTLAPSNMKYLFDSVVDFINHDMKVINLNCIFEEGWNQETAKEEYYQLKKLADYLIDNNLDNIYVAIFNERQEDMQMKENDGNFCFRGDTPILTIDGNRPIKELKVGDLVYTASGNINKITKMHKHKTNVRAYGGNCKITCDGPLPIYCTPDHMFYVRKFRGRNKGYSAPKFYMANDLIPGDDIAIPVIKLPEKKPDYNWLDEATAYLLGYYLGKGTIDKKKEFIYLEDGYLHPMFITNIHISNLTYLIDSDDDTIDTDEDWHIIKKNESPLNERFYKLCLSCGLSREKLHVPKLIFESPVNIILEFMNGLVDSMWDTEKLSEEEFEYSPIRQLSIPSIYLATDIFTILMSIGVYSDIVYNDEKENGVLLTFATIPTTNGVSMFELKLYKDNEGIIWLPVRAIRFDESDYDVYCPTVMPLEKGAPEEHTIVAGGLASQNCGGLGSMLSLRPNGQFYPCIRYMPTSVGNDVQDLCIGDVETGLVGREEGSEVLKMMDNITRRSQSNDICYECPISNDCAWCSACGHAVYGTPNKRPMFICIQMIAEALANVYYWNRLKLAHPEYDLPVRHNVVPEEWALLVIDKDELAELQLLEGYTWSREIELKHGIKPKGLKEMIEEMGGKY